MKVFRVAVRDLMENGNLSKNAKSFIACMQPYIYFPCNYIVYKCGNPDTKELTKMFDMGKTTLFETLKELEDKGVIKRIKRGGQMIIYVNPFLYSAGGLVEKDTYELFKDSIYSK
jgi:glutathionyl-hydroquinone reductase